MTKLSLRDKVEVEQFKIDYFISCFKKLRAHFNLNYTDNTIEEKRVVRLLRIINKKKGNIHSIGHKYIWNYVSYVFMVRQRKGIKFSWITSDESASIWLDKDENWFYFRSKWIDKNKISPPNSKTYESVDISEVEDRYRKRFLNSIKGLIICMENTSLIDPKSRVCAKCFNKIECKELLRKNRPELYQERYGRVK